VSLRRPASPRVEPRPDILEKSKPITPAANVRATIAHNPRLAIAVGSLCNTVLAEGKTPRRQRELLILRTGWNCEAEYEFGQHTLFGREAGISDDEIAALTRPLTTHAWSDADLVLLRMADELRADFAVTDQTWQELAVRWSTPEIFEFIFAVLCYMMVSGFLNATGVEIDPGVPGWPVPKEARG
jgi:4-carboxymuconolactone decarboxylase